MGTRFPHTLAALLLAVPLVSQEYRVERDEVAGIEFRVHEKLARTAGSAASVPHTLYMCGPADQGDWVPTKHVPVSWHLRVLEFPKDLDGVPESRIRARTFREWATRGDPGINNREILVEGEPRRGRRRLLDHTWWEFRDEITAEIPIPAALIGLRSKETVTLPIHFVAAVYDQPHREIALVGSMPLPGADSDKPDARFLGYLTTMVTSLQTFEPTAPSLEEMSPRDATLSQARTFVETSKGWDVIPGESHAVLFSWDPDRDSRKRDSQRFATKVNELLEALQPLFAAELPQHPRQVQHFPVARVCYDEEDFQHLSARSEGGAVAEFNRERAELLVFFDKERKLVRNERELLAAVAAAAWQQYAFFYFHVGTPVDLHSWYERGLAAWFGAHTVTPRRVSYRPDRDRARAIRSLVDDNRHLGMEELLTLSAADFAGPNEASHEAQAYALIDFLKRGPEDADGFDPAWGRIPDTYRATALDQRSPRQALAAALDGIDLAALQTAWVEWVKTELR